MIIRLLIGLGGIALLVLIVLAALEAPIGESFSRITEDLWGWVTLVDLYLGFVLIAIFMAYCEQRIGMAVFWILPMFFLGNIWSALWFVVRFSAIRKRFASAGGA
ncbi:MAG: hypothetical protein AAGE61_17675 [Pseudomonadota bacterium]